VFDVSWDVVAVTLAGVLVSVCILAPLFWRKALLLLVYHWFKSVTSQLLPRPDKGNQGALGARLSLSGDPQLLQAHFLTFAVHYCFDRFLRSFLRLPIQQAVSCRPLLFSIICYLINIRSFFGRDTQHIGVNN
jgi:hypothetical protein